VSAGIDWTQQLEMSVLAAIEDGKTLRDTANANNMSASAIIRHVQDSEDFAKQYARAKQIQVESFADEIINLSDSADRETYNVARLQVDTRKWLLSKLIPKKYGDKVEQFISGPDGAPMQAEITINLVKPPNGSS
jgi:hypothetical protein